MIMPLPSDESRWTLRRVVKVLAESIGVVNLAAIGDVHSIREIVPWLAGEHLPHDREPQLRFALRVALIIQERLGQEVAQAWFKGSNPLFGDRAPSLVLRDEFSREVQEQMLSAAQEVIE